MRLGAPRCLALALVILTQSDLQKQQRDRADQAERNQDQPEERSDQAGHEDGAKHPGEHERPS
jgi:hypothetical protein